MRLARRLILIGLMACAGVAAVDFMSFVSRADAVSPALPDDAQAVVALTGGRSRVAEAVALARRENLPLLISGVYAATSSEDIARLAGVDVAEIDCCVELGRNASTTAGNGLEVAEWARKAGHVRIVVVTSNYHMDRALLELSRAMPEARFTPHTVASHRTRPGDWWRDPGMARQMASEWIKYRYASWFGPVGPVGTLENEQ